MLHLQLLGPPLIKYSTPLAPFKSRKVEALFYYLSLIDGKHHRTHLATLLWSELPEENALSNLRFALWNLRKVLADAPITADRLTITSQPDKAVWVDVNEFRSHLKGVETNPNLAEAEIVKTLQQAADLYRGDFLSGFELSDAPFFEEWLQQQRAALRELAVEALTRLGTFYTTHHQLSEAITVTRRLLELEPWQEAAHRQMMILLTLDGQRGAALDHYQKCRQILAAELDLEPEPETTALMERIQAGNLELVDYSTSHLAKTPTLSEMNPASMPLFGRHAEYAWLMEHWEQARQGQGRVILLRGEAGVGKTRLIEEVSRSILASGGLLLRGRCYEFSGSVPYQPIAAALQSQIARLKKLKLALSDIWLAELSQLLPEIREHYPDLTTAFYPGQGANRYRLFEAVSRFLQATAAAQPVLLFLDDLHWADADTLDMLGYLVRYLAHASLLVIGSYRPDVVLNGHPLVTLRQAFFDEELLEELTLAVLAKEDVAEIVKTLPQTIANPQRLALFLTQISEGNPFIIFETLREMQEQGWDQSLATPNVPNGGGPLGQEALIPVKVQTRIRRRVARLSAESQQLLAVAAVIGREFEVELLQAVSNDPLAVVLDYLDDWLARYLVREIVTPEHPVKPAQRAQPISHHRYDFSHDLIRAVVYNDLSKVRRQMLHRQVGNALAELYTGQEEKVVERLAHHFHLGHESDKALLYLQQAGQQAQAVYALPIALSRYEQALSHWERLYSPVGATTPPDVLRERWNLLLNQARICYMLGQREKQGLALNTVAYEVVNWGNKRDQLQIIVQQLVYLRKTIDLNHRRLAAQEGLGLARSLGDDLAEGNILQALGNCDRDVGHYGQALDHYNAALQKFSKLEQTRQAAFCLINMGGTHLINNRLSQALACFKEAEQYGQAGHHQDALIWAMIGQGYSWLLCGDAEKAQTINQAALDLCDQTGFQRAMSVGLILQGSMSDLFRRDWEQGLAHYERAWHISQEMGQTSRMVDIECCLGHHYLRRGLPEAALTHFEQAQIWGENTFNRRLIEVKSYQALAYLALGHLDEALEYSYQAIAHLMGRMHGLEAAQRLYWNHSQILQAWGRIDEAQTALITAYQMVLDQIDNLLKEAPRTAESLALKEQFVTRLPWNRDIIAAWEKLSFAR